MEDLAGGPMLRPPGIAPAGAAGNKEPVSRGPGPSLPSARPCPRQRGVNRQARPGRPPLRTSGHSSWREPRP